MCHLGTDSCVLCRSSTGLKMSQCRVGRLSFLPRLWANLKTSTQRLRRSLRRLCSRSISLQRLQESSFRRCCSTTSGRFIDKVSVAGTTSIRSLTSNHTPRLNRSCSGGLWYGSGVRCVAVGVPVTLLWREFCIAFAETRTPVMDPQIGGEFFRIEKEKRTTPQARLLGVGTRLDPKAAVLRHCVQCNAMPRLV